MQSEKLVPIALPDGGAVDAVSLRSEQVTQWKYMRKLLFNEMRSIEFILYYIRSIAKMVGELLQNRAVECANAKCYVTEKGMLNTIKEHDWIHKKEELAFR